MFRLVKFCNRGKIDRKLIYNYNYMFGLVRFCNRGKVNRKFIINIIIVKCLCCGEIFKEERLKIR